jgi:hypothetical protein
MPSSTPAAGSGRYIIRSRDSMQLAELIRRIAADPEIMLIDTIGPPGAPHTCVVTMSPERAAALELQFRTTNQFTIEPDRPLSLFGGV